MEGSNPWIPRAKFFDRDEGSVVCFQTRLLTFTKPRHIFVYYVASLNECAYPSELWIEHTDVSRKCCQKFAEFRHSIVFECCLAHSFRRWRPRSIFRS